MTKPSSEHGAIAAAFDRHARDYDAARRMLVPCFDDFYGAAMAGIPFPADAPLTIVDIGAGSGLMADMALQRWPRARAILIDLSAEMLDEARRRLASHGGRVEFHIADYVMQPLPTGIDVALSALSIHHVVDADKKRLFARVFEALTPGGVFVNAEQVLGPTPAIERRYRRMWEEMARARGAGDDDIAAAKARMIHDQAATLADQMGWLADAGFVEVDCQFKQYAFAVYGGCKKS